MNTILKIVALLAFVFASLQGITKSNSDKIYNMYLREKGVTILSFSKSTVEPFEIFMDDLTRDVTRDMEKIRFLAYNEPEGHFSSVQVFERIIDELSGNTYFIIDPDEIDDGNCELDVNDDDVKLIGRGNRNYMDELHIIFIDNETCFLVSFFGKTNIDDIRNLACFSHSAHWDWDWDF